MKNHLAAVVVHSLRWRSDVVAATLLICSVPSQFALSAPSPEFLSFSTRGHREAKGTDFTIAYPQGWLPSESTAPNVIHSFKNVSGAKGEQLTVKVNAEFAEHIPLELRGQSEMAKVFMDDMNTDSEIISIMYPKPAIVLSQKRLRLNGAEAVQFQIRTTHSALGRTFDVFLYETIIYHGGLLITFRFGFWDAREQSRATLQQQFQQRLPFYDRVLQATVLPDQKQSPPREASATVAEQATGWSKVIVPDVCSFSIPPNMEVRSGLYKQLYDLARTKAGEVYHFDPNVARLTIQPKGLNEGGKNRPRTYARIMFETLQGLPGQFPEMNESIELSAEDLKEISDAFHAHAEQQLQLVSDTKLINWSPPVLTNLNGIDVLEMRYRRTGKESPVLVRTYWVGDYNKAYLLTLSFRESEKETWEPLFKKTLETIRFSTPVERSSPAGASAP